MAAVHPGILRGAHAAAGLSVSQPNGVVESLVSRRAAAASELGSWQVAVAPVPWPSSRVAH